MNKEIGKPYHYLGVNWRLLSGIQYDGGELRYDYHEHEAHNHEKRKKHESRINEGILSLRRQRVLAVKIFRKVEKRLVQLAGFFSGFHHINVKFGKNIGVLGKRS